ncbi:hypothetical protein N7513_005996 [Penicillium frequentans]|nr:hypothetical protein N7513_005996 [Penicillium glabrum]
MPRQQRRAAPTPRAQRSFSPYRCSRPSGSLFPAAGASFDRRRSPTPGSSHAGRSSAERRSRSLRPDGFHRCKTPLTYPFLVYSGVAVGSSIGHAIGGFFGGGGSSAPAEAQQAPPAQSQGMDSGLWQSSATNQSWENPACEANVRDFRNCMDENNGNISICGWYMDQLKACQAAAKPY